MSLLSHAEGTSKTIIKTVLFSKQSRPKNHKQNMLLLIMLLIINTEALPYLTASH